MMPHVHPLERLINLVALLLDARTPLTFERIRELLPAYAQGDSSTAKRMFERDKDILRDNGVPIEVVPTDAFDVEEGYTIPKDRYYLPEISFTPREISALFVAARSGGEDDSAEQGARKLLSGSADSLLGGLEAGPLALGPDVDADLVTAVAEAVLQGSRRLRFGYTTALGAGSERSVNAYGLVWRAGHWYLVGLDTDRGEIRAFRLSRFSGGVADAGEGSQPPAGFRAAEHVHAGPWGPGAPASTATVALSPEVAWWALAGLEGAERVEPAADGWVRVRLPSGDGGGLASWVLSFGPDARVESPRSLRDEVVRRLEALLAV
jgi:proteasome accessory factor B